MMYMCTSIHLYVCVYIYIYIHTYIYIERENFKILYSIVQVKKTVMSLTLVPS